MRQLLAHDSMDFGIALANDRAASICKATSIIEFALYESRMAWSEVIDVLPRLSRIE